MTQGIQQLTDIMSGTYSRDISLYDESFLARSLEKRLSATPGLSAEVYLQSLSSNIVEAEEFFRSLNISFSEFFRNPLTFAFLESLVVPKLAEEHAGKSEIRIWSAGCAAGQEAYSIAMLLDEFNASREKQVSFRIFATDISEQDIVVARNGVYDSTAVQDVRLKHVNTYFTRKGEIYTIRPRLAEHVNFSLYDLLDQHTLSPEASIYGGFDIVFCCNLLFYYTPAIQQRILDKISRALAPGGYLVTGEAERSIIERILGYPPVLSPVAVYRKGNQ